jgi:heat shock protein HspQ
MIMIRRPNGESQQDETGPPAFVPGQLVRHRRYGYRGVVVAADRRCEADKAWYQKNQTQPNRRQPWYHVFVHDTAIATYAAQQNLEADDSGEPIRHPLVTRFFKDFRGGRYLRNDQAWPEWDGGI